MWHCLYSFFRVPSLMYSHTSCFLHAANRRRLTAPSAVHTAHSTCSTCPALTPPLWHTIPLPLPATSPAHCSRTTWIQSAWVVQTGQLCSDRETGLSGAESWRVALAVCRILFLLAAILLPEAQGTVGAGLAVLWLSVSLHPEISSSVLETLQWSAGPPTVNGHNMGSEEAYNFVFKGEYIITCQAFDCSPSDFKRCFVFVFSLFLVMFVYPSNHTSLFGISSTVPKHMAEPGLYIHISVFRLLGILLGLN